VLLCYSDLLHTTHHTPTFPHSWKTLLCPTSRFNDSGVLSGRVGRSTTTTTTTTGSPWSAYTERRSTLFEAARLQTGIDYDYEEDNWSLVEEDNLEEEAGSESVEAEAQVDTEVFNPHHHTQTGLSKQNTGSVSSVGAGGAAGLRTGSESMHPTIVEEL